MRHPSKFPLLSTFLPLRMILGRQVQFGFVRTAYSPRTYFDQTPTLYDDISTFNLTWLNPAKAEEVVIPAKPSTPKSSRNSSSF